MTNIPKPVAKYSQDTKREVKKGCLTAAVIQPSLFIYFRLIIDQNNA